jgi:RNA polymerase-interacting CarD/CdnL/TRCF family regulator
LRGCWQEELAIIPSTIFLRDATRRGYEAVARIEDLRGNPMNYHIGDQVVHWTYGPGTIIGIDEKVLANKARKYYVVEVERMTLWVPIGDAGEKSIRPPTPGAEFKKLLKLLRGPCKQLPDQQSQRQSELSERMKRRTLAEICCIIRDLVARSRTQKLNRNDADTLRRAEEFLLNEWELALRMPRETAQREMDSLLEEVE